MNTPQSRAVLFTNKSSEDFTHSWDSVPYTFKAGQSMYLQDFLAFHFAKHLADREVQKIAESVASPKHKILMESYVSLNDPIIAKSDTSLDTELMNQPASEITPLEKARAKLAENRAKKQEEFSDLKENEATS